MNNSLAEVHPELISEWSEKNLPLTPDDITFGSNKKSVVEGTRKRSFSLIRFTEIKAFVKIFRIKARYVM